MEKTRMMEQRCFERLSQLMADKGVIHEAFELLADLRMSERNFAEKAAAYDRLMSGGKKTLKELANFLGRVVAVDANGNVESFAEEPRIDLHYGFWYLDEDDEDCMYFIPKNIVDFNGDWKNSLTLPDGWDGREGEYELGEL